MAIAAVKSEDRATTYTHARTRGRTGEVNIYPRNTEKSRYYTVGGGGGGVDDRTV